MPCFHKFYPDLRLERLTFTPEILVVGSFNPAWPESNTAQWFYGRTDSNYFWDVLPRLFGVQSLLNATPDAWKAFCTAHKIAITDLIGCIEDADATNQAHHKILGGFSDEAIVHHFGDFEFIDVAALLKTYPTIRRVYLTRGIRETYWRHLWGQVMHYADRNNVYEKQLLTPSGNASYQHSAYNKSYPETQPLSLNDYILMRWQEVWHTS